MVDSMKEYTLTLPKEIMDTVLYEVSRSLVDLMMKDGDGTIDSYEARRLPAVRKAWESLCQQSREGMAEEEPELQELRWDSTPDTGDTVKQAAGIQINLDERQINLLLESIITNITLTKDRIRLAAAAPGRDRQLQAELLDTDRRDLQALKDMKRTLVQQLAESMGAGRV